MRRTKEALRAQRIIWCGLLVATVATAQIPAGHGTGGALAMVNWPVKHLLPFSGSEGTLVVAEDRIFYRTETLGESRTWCFADIDNISSSGPDQLTITTFERARGHYGNRKGFNFVLKRPLDEARYNDLWRRLERAKGAQTIQNIRSERAASLSN